MKVHRIFVPTDYSQHSLWALQWAVSLAWKYAAQLLLLHVVPQGSERGAMDGCEWIGIPYSRDAEASLHRLPFHSKATIHLYQYADSRLPRDVSAKMKVAMGNPAMEILKAAHDQAADLIVMGTHGRTGLRYLLLGSTAETVVRNAPCPVFLVPDTTTVSTKLPEGIGTPWGCS